MQKRPIFVGMGESLLPPDRRQKNRFKKKIQNAFSVFVFCLFVKKKGKEKGKKIRNVLMSVGKLLVPESSGKSTDVTSSKTQANRGGDLCVFQRIVFCSAHTIIRTRIVIEFVTHTVIDSHSHRVRDSHTRSYAHAYTHTCTHPHTHMPMGWQGEVISLRNQGVCTFFFLYTSAHLAPGIMRETYIYQKRHINGPYVFSE